jgi:hypothetical protein
MINMMIIFHIIIKMLKNPIFKMYLNKFKCIYLQQDF